MGEGSVKFEDSFEATENPWDIKDDLEFPYTREQRSIVASRYRMSVLFIEDALTTSTIPFVNPSDFYLSFDATVVDLPEDEPIRITVSFRIDEAGNYYSARFGSDGSYSLYIRDGEQFYPIVPWTESQQLSISEGAINTFAVQAKGWIISLCFNGEELVSVTDSRISTAGRIGIGLSGIKGTTSIADFDNVVVKEEP